MHSIKHIFKLPINILSRPDLGKLRAGVLWSASCWRVHSTLCLFCLQVRQGFTSQLVDWSIHGLINLQVVDWDRSVFAASSLWVLPLLSGSIALIVSTTLVYIVLPATISSNPALQIPSHKVLIHCSEELHPNFLHSFYDKADFFCKEIAGWLLFFVAPLWCTFLAHVPSLTCEDLGPSHCLSILLELSAPVFALMHSLWNLLPSVLPSVSIEPMIFIPYLLYVPWLLNI